MITFNNYCVNNVIYITYHRSAMPLALARTLNPQHSTLNYFTLSYFTLNPVISTYVGKERVSAGLHSTLTVRFSPGIRWK